jgi:hypothetical protein
VSSSQPFCVRSSVPVRKRETQREQTFRYPKISIISWTAWCPTPSCAAFSLIVTLLSCLMSSSTFLLVALSCNSSRSTSARLIGDDRSSVLKMFRPPSDTAGTHADITIHTTELLVDDSCRVSLFHKKFNDNVETRCR